MPEPLEPRDAIAPADAIDPDGFEGPVERVRDLARAPGNNGSDPETGLDADLDDEWDDWDDTEDGAETHRGAFGDFGGETAALIERTFREKIVLVGVTMPPSDDDDTERSLEELALLVDTAGA